MAVFNNITERKRAEAAIKDQEAELAAIYEHAPLIMLLVDGERRVCKANKAAEEFTGAPDLLGKRGGEALRCLHSLDDPNGCGFGPHCRQCIVRSTIVSTFETGRSHRQVEARLPFTAQGERQEVTFLLSTARINIRDQPYVLVTIQDITAAKKAEQEREVAIEFLRLVNASTGIGELIRAATTFFQEQSGCEAVGIRLKEGDDYPYYEARGFPKEFLLLENQLCARDAAGRVCRDSTGNPLIECMCGNVIYGHVNPKKPFFTAGGSFWANDTARLLATTTDEDRQARTRNCCNGEGYESVALVPLRVGTEPFGLLQLNDRRRGMFAPETIALWERLAGYLAVAVAKARADEALKQHAEGLGFLSGTATRMLGSASFPGICKLAANRIYSLAGGATVIFNEFDVRSRKTIVREACCTPEERERLFRILGREPEGITVDFPEASRAQIAPGELSLVEGGMHDLTFGQMPRPLCQRIEQELGLGDIFAVACATDEDIQGTVAILTHRRGAVRNKKLIESVVNQAALALKRTRAEEALAVLARLYAVLSRVNEAIVRTRDEEWLYHETCRIVAEEGGFPLVWIGIVKELEVVPAAWGGPATDYLRQIKAEVEGDLGSGPTGTCVREERPVVNDDFDTNPSMTPWREPALAHGFRASAAFPLRRQGRVIGALTLYAPTPGAFDPEHVKLLESLCADISYALDALEQERLRTEAERALRESERNLREADRRKNEFMAVLSHELRNPLAPIKNSLYILDRAVPGGDQARRAQAVIDRQVGQLVRLVDDLLDVTRITRNKIHLQRQRLELNDLVRRTMEDHRSLFEKSEVRLELHLAPQPVFVSADWNRLAQVVGNLLQNAAKFTDRGGSASVSVATDAAARRAIIRMADTGVGMAPEMLARLFQPFMQADTTLDRNKGGLGLGLALVKGLVELHGGEISAHSAGLGKGAEFVVRLPLDLAGAAQIDAGPTSRQRSRWRVLIIEDNNDAADSLREAFESGGHEIAVAYNGLDGIQKARECDAEVVLCDISLPGLDGYEVARAFRDDGSLRSVYLVALSGYALPEDLVKAKEAGFDHHLAKPPSMEKLEQILADLPAEHSAHSRDGRDPQPSR